LFICSGGVVSCTLWDEYCKKFLERYNDNPNTDKLVMILTQAKVKAATSSYVVILFVCQKIFIMFQINFGLNRGMANVCVQYMEWDQITYG